MLQQTSALLLHTSSHRQVFSLAAIVKPYLADVYPIVVLELYWVAKKLEISMPQTCLYNISARTSYHRGIWLWFGITLTVHSWVTVAGYSLEYEYRLLCQLTTTVGGTTYYLLLEQSQSNSLQGRMKCFSSHLGLEQNSSGWKVTGYLQTGCSVTSQKNYGELFLCVALWWCWTNRSNAGVWHSVCINASKLT